MNFNMSLDINNVMPLALLDECIERCQNDLKDLNKIYDKIPADIIAECLAANNINFDSLSVQQQQCLLKYM